MPLHENKDLYLNSNTLLLAPVFGKFRKICLKIYHLDAAKLLWVSGLLWQTTFKKTEVKIELLTDIDMLLMVEKSIREGISHATNRYVKLIKNIWKIIITIRNRHILNIGI